MDPLRAARCAAGRARAGGGVLAALALAAATIAGCGRSGSGSVPGARGARVQVVAAENFWGSIAAQLGGRRVRVRSIVSDPATDPHSYQPTAGDARTISGASMVIVNGIGYDEWARRLLGASPASGRTVLSVGELLGLKEGANAHQWYAPPSVHRVVEAIIAGYERLDPAAAGYFARQGQIFERRSLARYDRLRAEIRARYARVPVGYSESIFRPLGEDLRLQLRTPYSFAKAVAEGTDVTARDKQAVDAQARGHRIAVWVFNSQNVSPDVQRVNEIARAERIPVATVTETLSPASYTFEQWQVAQLEALARALHRATGR